VGADYPPRFWLKFWGSLGCNHTLRIMIMIIIYLNMLMPAQLNSHILAPIGVLNLIEKPVRGPCDSRCIEKCGPSRSGDCLRFTGGGGCSKSNQVCWSPPLPPAAQGSLGGSSGSSSWGSGLLPPAIHLAFRGFGIPPSIAQVAKRAYYHHHHPP
jgi:hypothetical protein